MKIHIYHLIEGAKQAKGLTVIIDVFRAFSLECYLYHYGVKEIRVAGSIEEAKHLKELYPEAKLIGERKGIKIEGFDYGNSPSEIAQYDLTDALVIHTTSAGTQGVINAKDASSIIGGSLVNAKAIAKYILEQNPEEVSLVCMGNMGTSLAKEDELCARYIKSILEGHELDISQEVVNLQYDGGEHFFDPNKPEFPTQDFYLCTMINRFNYVVEINHDKYSYITKKYEVKSED